MGKIYAVISVVAVIALLSCLGGEQQPPENETTQNGGGEQVPVNAVEISIQDNAFSQTEVFLNAGDSIEWTNLDDRVHQVLIIGVTTSVAMHKDERWIYRFNTAGRYEFRDTDLPYMEGTITVS